MLSVTQNTDERITVDAAAWQERTPRLSKPFAGADARFFDQGHAPGAVCRLLEGC